VVVVDDDGILKTSYICLQRCDDTASKTDWSAAVDREQLVGVAAAMVFGVDMMKEVNEWRK
jgi:hypothetical protein